MKNIFVDESGDLGIKDKYFVITLFITNDNKGISRSLKKFCIHNDLDEIKSSKLTFDQKQFLFEKLKNYSYSVSYIVVDKHKMIKERIFKEKNLFYYYLSSIILEKELNNTEENINIIFDNRSIKYGSENTLADHIKINAYTRWNIINNIDVSFIDSKKSKMIQATDLMANAIYARYNYDKTHFYNKITNINNVIEYPINSG
jgi:hypothetical protein